MATTYTDTTVNNLIINQLTLDEYTTLENNSQINGDELYLITDDNTTIDDYLTVDTTGATSGSANTINADTLGGYAIDNFIVPLSDWTTGTNVRYVATQGVATSTSTPSTTTYQGIVLPLAIGTDITRAGLTMREVNNSTGTVYRQLYQSSRNDGTADGATRRTGLRFSFNTSDEPYVSVIGAAPFAATGAVRNIEVRTTSATGTLQSTNKIIMVRK